MEKGQQLVRTELIDGFVVVYVGYLYGDKPVTPRRFASAVARSNKLASSRPVVIITYDRVPPRWAIPTVQGFCVDAKMVACDMRDASSKSCLVLATKDNVKWPLASTFRNPDRKDPAWQVGNETKSDGAGRSGRH